MGAVMQIKKGLNITVMGSPRKLNAGILADPEQVPDIEAIRDALVDEPALSFVGRPSPGGRLDTP